MKCLLKLIFVTLILFVFVIGCSSPEDKKLSHFNKGNAYFEAKKFKSAEIEFKNAIQIDSRYKDALLKLGDTMMKLGQGRQAFSAYSQVEKISPDNIQALINLTTFYFLDNRLDEANARIEKVLAQDKNNIEALYLRAQILTRQNEFEVAETIFKKILEIEKNHIFSLQGLARLKNFQKKFDQAEALLLKAVDAAPNATQPRFVLVNFYLSRKDLSKAEEQLNLAAGENPTNADIQITLGEFYLKTKNTDLSEKSYKKAVEIAPNKVKPYLTLAKFYDIIGKTENALAFYEKAIIIDPENISAMQALARYQYKNKNLDAAEKQVSEIMEQRPEFYPAKMLQSEILIFKKEFEKAMQILTLLEKEEPNAPRVHYFKGMCHIGLGDPNQAAASVEKAVELRPGELKAHLLLADIYFQQRSFDLAVNQASEVLKLNDSTQRALMIRANSQLALKKYKEAEQDYKKMIEIGPDDPAGYYYLAYLKSSMKQYDKAEDLLEKAYSFDNQRLDVFLLMVEISMAQKKNERAHNLCTQQIEIAKDNKRFQAIVHNIQASIYVTEKKFNDAKTFYTKAIETDPDYLTSYSSLAKLFLAQKELKNAIDQYNKILEKNPNLAPPHMMLGTIYEMDKAYDKAEEHYKKALKINPEFGAAANNLAYHLATHTNKYDEALQYAKKAKEHFPENPSVMDTMGFAYYKKELYGNAVNEFIDSLKQIPDNPVVHYHLGLAYNKKGNIELARKELSRALEISSNFPDAEKAKTLLEELNKE